MADISSALCSRQVKWSKCQKDFPRRTSRWHSDWREQAGSCMKEEQLSVIHSGSFCLNGNRYYCAASFMFSLPEIDTNSSQFINVTSSHSLVSFTSRPSFHSILPRGPQEFHVSGWSLRWVVFLLSIHTESPVDQLESGVCAGDVPQFTFHLEFGCRDGHKVFKSIVSYLLISVFSRDSLLLLDARAQPWSDLTFDCKTNKTV